MPRFARVERAAARRLRGLPGVALFAFVWTVANLVWLVAERTGQPLNIDEAGYFGFALHDAHAWQRRGPSGWVDQVLWPGVHAPVTSAVASLGVLVFGPHPAIGFVVVVLAGAATLLLTALLAGRVRRPEVMWGSVVVVAVSADFVAFSRVFVFAVPVTVVTTAALYFLARSRHLTRLPWALLFGLCVGLTPLTRTMAIALLPALALASLAQALVSDRRRAALLNTVAAGIVAAAVAGSWLIPSRKLVWDHLTGYGYGAQSRSYASSRSSLGSLVAILANTTYLPVFALVVAGWLLSIWYAADRARRDGRPAVVRGIRSPLFPCAVFALGGCAAIASVRTGGTGYALPLLPPAAIVASWGAWQGWRTLRSPTVRRATTAGVVLVVSLAVLGLAVPNSWFGERRTVHLGATGDLIVTAGAHQDPAYLRTRSATFVNEEGWSAAWRQVSQRLLDRLLTGPDPSAAFAFRGYFVNVNTVQLEALEKLRYPIPVVQIEPEIQHGARRYRRWLVRGGASASCFLLTSPGPVNEFTPLVQTRTLERVARDAGFSPVGHEPMPDGRTVHVWKRAAHGC